MAIIAGKAGYGLIIALFSLSLSGCGLTQRVADGTVSATKSLFYRQIKTLHLDIRAGRPLTPVLPVFPCRLWCGFISLKTTGVLTVRIIRRFLQGTMKFWQAISLHRKMYGCSRGGSVAVDMPLDDAAKFTGVAAMFLEPDQKKNTWRVVLGRDELEPDTPRLIEVSGNTLTLLPVKDK